jgi:hypothetical protein
VKTLKQLELERIRVQTQINELKEKEMEEKHYPALRKSAGKSFIYRRNCYSCPEEPSDYWDVYKKVLEVVEANGSLYFVIEEFSVDRNGKCSLIIDDYYPYPDGRQPFTGGWEEITAGEYAEAKGEFLKEMQTYKKLKKVLAKNK